MARSQTLAAKAGEPETREEQERRKTGIPYSGSEIAVLQAEAARAGVAPLPMLDRPDEA